MKKWIALFLLSLIVLITIGFWFYNSIQADHRSTLAAAKSRALKETDLVTVTGAMNYSGEQSCTVVTGQDEQQRDMIVWVTDESVHAEYADEGVTEQHIRERMLAADPELELLRVVPGILNDNYVWEVFAKKSQGQKEKHYYYYFRFKDGEKLDEYRLSK